MFALPLSQKAAAARQAEARGASADAAAGLLRGRVARRRGPRGPSPDQHRDPGRR